MPVVQERLLYTLAELKEKGGTAYDRALDMLRYSDAGYDWWDDTLESEKDHIRETYGIGYDPKQVTFDTERGSFVCFGKSTDIDDRVVLKKAGLDLRTKEARTLIDRGLVIGYYPLGAGSVRSWIGFYEYEHIPDWAASEATIEAIEQVLTDAENDLLKSLRDEREYLDSEEYLLEHAEANEYLFDEEGRRP